MQGHVIQLGVLGHMIDQVTWSHDRSGDLVTWSIAKLLGLLPKQEGRVSHALVKHKSASLKGYVLGL